VPLSAKSIVTLLVNSKAEPYQPQSIARNWGARCHRGQRFSPVTT